MDAPGMFSSAWPPAEATMRVCWHAAAQSSTHQKRLPPLPLQALPPSWPQQDSLAKSGVAPSLAATAAAAAAGPAGVCMVLPVSSMATPSDSASSPLPVAPRVSSPSSSSSSSADSSGWDSRTAAAQEGRGVRLQAACGKSQLRLCSLSLPVTPLVSTPSCGDSSDSTY
jgi:hypothetical protein